jgi:hypothetical protein
MKMFKMPLEELQFDIKSETSALSVQKLCSIENWKFSTLTSYNSETKEFWAKQKYTYPIIFIVVLISFIGILKISFALFVRICIFLRRSTWGGKHGFLLKVGENYKYLPKNSHQNSYSSTALKPSKTEVLSFVTDCTWLVTMFT